MIPEKPSQILNTGTTLALALSLFFCTFRVFADEPDQLYSDLSLTNTASGQSTVNKAKGTRLSDLLKWKESVSDILSPGPGRQEPDYEEQSGSPDFSKRVFCNGFTGCGGRFRGRRRMQEPESDLLPISKRPFCNSYGCYNSGRKRFGQSAVKNKNETPQGPSHKFVNFPDGSPWLRIKKLFCNGYGGCQNMGKRMMLRNSDVSKEESSGQGLPPLFSKALDLAGGKKRFISSNFDDEIDSLRR